MIEILTSDDTTALDEIELMSPLRIKKYRAIKYGKYVNGICNCCGSMIPTNDCIDAIFEDEVNFCYNCGANIRNE